jgi:hypothetical protein
VDLSLLNANVLGIYFENLDVSSLSQINFLASALRPITVPAEGFSKKAIRN